MADERWVVWHDGVYYCGPVCDPSSIPRPIAMCVHWDGAQRNATLLSKETAHAVLVAIQAYFTHVGHGRVVRLLSREEAKARAVATELRALATYARRIGSERLRMVDWAGQSVADTIAEAAEARANALWPARAAGSGGRR